MAKSEFWRQWSVREKELKRSEPKCTCGFKQPERAMHYPLCPYWLFWWREFNKFQEEYKEPVKLDKWVR